VFTVYVGVDPV